jgi:hypothetical protein
MPRHRKFTTPCWELGTNPLTKNGLRNSTPPLLSKASGARGAKMYFIGSDENGEKGGMISEIADIQPNRFVSIRHYGLVHGGKEITEGPEVEKWAGNLENYHFEERDEKTFIIVEVDTDEAHVDYMEKAFPKALAKLKEICESNNKEL